MVEYERWRLRELGAEQLASKVDWVATSKGDGLGYDVLSYEMDGTPKHIEVKTTAFGISTPFLSLIHISEPTRQEAISYAVFCL